MDFQELRQAHCLLKKIHELGEIKDEIGKRDVEFVKGQHLRPLGRMQLGETQIRELRYCMKAAAIVWFDTKISEIEKQLAEMGISKD